MKREKPMEEGHPPKKFKCYNQEKMSSSWTLYNDKFPYFREPTEIGAFSIDSNRGFHDDKSQLKVFIPPSDFENCLFDLKVGYHKMIRKDESVNSFISDLLRWTMLHREKFITKAATHTEDRKNPSSSSTSFPNNSSSKSNSKFHSLNTDFVCWRGLLTRILCIPYENREDLRIAVIRSRGTYFMCQFETDAKKKREEEMTERDKEMCAWGWKFEQYVTAALEKGERLEWKLNRAGDACAVLLICFSPTFVLKKWFRIAGLKKDEAHGKPDTDKPVNNNEEYGVVVRSRLGSHSLVYGAEVDCTDPLDPTSRRYLELKTSRKIESRRQYENFCRFKLIKFWAQSFLIGIQRIICGFRDDDGVVHQLKEFQVKDIPKLSSSVVRNGWNPAVCFNFLDSFLSFVKANVPSDDDRCAYVFYWKPGSQLILEGKGEEAFHFLPDWFLKWEKWDMPI